MLVFLFYLLLGAVTGILAGLFGVSGGLIMVPAFLFSFAWQGIDPNLITLLAIATSLALIMSTSLTAGISHYKKGSVDLKIFLFLALGIAFGATFGVKINTLISPKIIKTLLAIFIFSFSIKTFIDVFLIKKDGTKTKKTANFVFIIAGVFIGTLSSIFGIGGGMFTVPFLTSRGFNMKKTAGISACCGFPIAFFSTINYVISGWNNPNLPDWSFGYVYLPALFGVMLTSSLFSIFGTKLSYKLSNKLLKILFAVFLLFVGILVLLEN